MLIVARVVFVIMLISSIVFYGMAFRVPVVSAETSTSTWPALMTYSKNVSSIS